MTDLCFESYPVTLLVARAYARMEDYSHALALLGIYMGLHPHHHEGQYREMARLLKKQGNDRTAAAMLEAGWALRKKGLRHSEWEKAKHEYFA